MPEWLKALLAAQGSLGFADTLSQVVGKPEYFMMQDRQRNGSPVGGGFQLTDDNVARMGITPTIMQHYGNVGAKLYPGYKGADPRQKLGDMWLGHEFGHMAVLGTRNFDLTDRLVAAYPGAQTTDKEGFADSFQNAVQFLRSHSTDIGILSPASQRIARALLQEPIYSKHPLNQAVALQGVLPQLMRR